MRDNYTGSLREKLDGEFAGTGVADLPESTELSPAPFHVPPTLSPEMQAFKERMDAKLMRDRNYLSS